MNPSSQSGIVRWSTASVAALALAAAATGSTIEPVSTRDRLVLSDAIVFGTVTGVEHRNSTVVNSRHVALPHAFVKIQVERSFKGDPKPGDALTLRVEGGPDGSGRTLQVLGVPTFEAGDQGFFFVKDNGAAICPLVGWEQGHLRVVRGDVYDEHGQEVWVAPDGEFLLGDKSIDVHTRLHPPLPKAAEDEEAMAEGRRFSPPAGSMRLVDTAFGDLLTLMVSELTERGEMPPPPPTKSADPNLPFFVDELVARQPPTDTSEDGPLFRGDFDAREAEMVRRLLKGIDIDDG